MRAGPLRFGCELLKCLSDQSFSGLRQVDSRVLSVGINTLGEFRGQAELNPNPLATLHDWSSHGQPPVRDLGSPRSSPEKLCCESNPARFRAPVTLLGVSRS